MTDGDALYQAILTDPACDTARLVYADWLQENGQPERAEFIRVQVRLARDDAEDAANNWLGTNPLRRREQKLGEAFGEVWLGELKGRTPWMVTPGRYSKHIKPNVGVVYATFHRGFVAEIRLPTDLFTGGPCPGCIEPGELDDGDPRCRMCKGAGRTLGLAKAIFSAHPVTRVVLTDALIFRSGGNNLWYVGGIGRFPSKYWQRLDDLPSYGAADDALEAVCVEYGRELAGITSPSSVTTPV